MLLSCKHFLFWVCLHLHVVLIARAVSSTKLFLRIWRVLPLLFILLKKIFSHAASFLHHETVSTYSMSIFSVVAMILCTCTISTGMRFPDWGISIVLVYPLSVSVIYFWYLFFPFSICFYCTMSVLSSSNPGSKSYIDISQFYNTYSFPIHSGFSFLFYWFGWYCSQAYCSVFPQSISSLLREHFFVTYPTYCTSNGASLKANSFTLLNLWNLHLSYSALV